MSDQFDPGPGYFDRLDDPAAPAPDRETLDAVVRRGRQIRTRRHTAFAVSGAAAVAAVVAAGLGLSHAFTASSGNDRIQPLRHGSASPAASAGPHKHGHKARSGLTQVLVPGDGAAAPTGGGHASPPPSASPPAAPDCTAVAASPAPTGSPVAIPPPVPTASPACAGSASPSPSPTGSPAPTGTASPTSTPTVAPSGQALGTSAATSVRPS